MPAWSKASDDEAICIVVSFVREMPDMTPEIYQKLTDMRSDNSGSSRKTERNASQASIAH